MEGAQHSLSCVRPNENTSLGKARCFLLGLECGGCRWSRIEPGSQEQWVFAPEVVMGDWFKPPYCLCGLMGRLAIRMCDKARCPLVRWCLNTLYATHCFRACRKGSRLSFRRAKACS